MKVRCGAELGALLYLPISLLRCLSFSSHADTVNRRLSRCLATCFEITEQTVMGHAVATRTACRHVRLHRPIHPREKWHRGSPERVTNGCLVPGAKGFLLFIFPQASVLIIFESLRRLPPSSSVVFMSSVVESLCFLAPFASPYLLSLTMSPSLSSSERNVRGCSPSGSASSLDEKASTALEAMLR
ncbi:hypothetical protein BHE74_00027614 [Ensete ventricosum]|nr:hypothetical protein GW17_00021549 [Ensete ventricosum]RWW65104.1 hypothetical protein BHE74_00027614 [Ensete ventricosum]RZS05676.1 hypothetical protein BHM03_00036221 [Ensete ventricosum]